MSCEAASKIIWEAVEDRRGPGRGLVLRAEPGTFGKLDR
jgi:hypothetical protein